ncbi:MAG: hypothetical protein JXX29_11015 [Deltaproteobacteria bacterium]|nr:hypothetical protein [Deltaproteobacteria bacterium]MBN2672200.1 hypothetical protein [Deltaproteobacteria bacterium]
MYYRSLPIFLAYSVLLFVAACGPSGQKNTLFVSPVDPRSLDTESTPDSEASDESSAVHTAQRFWNALAERNYPDAVGMASFPFDMDGVAECIYDAKEMTAFFADNALPPDKRIVVRGAELLDADNWQQLDERWHEKIKHFTEPDARCLTAESDEYQTMHTVFVDFTVNNETVGALTRVRCTPHDCTVAGIDN